MVQALGLWSELEAAYYGKNSYGGDTAEIYLYRLMPNDPSAEEAHRRKNEPSHTIFGQARREQVTNANKALHSLLKHFARTREARIEVNGKELGDWLKAADFDHRVHVKVVGR